MDARTRNIVQRLVDEGRYSLALSEANVSDVGMYWPDERAESCLRNIDEALKMINIHKNRKAKK